MVQKQEPQSLQAKSIILDSLSRKSKYFMLHTSNTVYGMNNFSVDTSQLVITGTLTDVPEEHSLYLQPHRHWLWGSNKIYYKQDSGILNEVHLYTVDTINNSSVNLPVQNIQKIEVIGYDKKKTNTVSIVSATVLIGLTTALIVAFAGLSQWN